VPFPPLRIIIMDTAPGVLSCLQPQSEDFHKATDNLNCVEMPSLESRTLTIKEPYKAHSLSDKNFETNLSHTTSTYAKCFLRMYLPPRPTTFQSNLGDLRVTNSNPYAVLWR
jgi:hypothetical protein